jgi:hypothetical protein
LPLCCRSPLRSWLTEAERASFAVKESADIFANGNRAFEVGEMSAVFQRNHVRIWNCLSDAFGRGGGDEFVITGDDQRRGSSSS